MSRLVWSGRYLFEEELSCRTGPNSNIFLLPFSLILYSLLSRHLFSSLLRQFSSFSINSRGGFKVLSLEEQQWSLLDRAIHPAYDPNYCYLIEWHLLEVLFKILILFAVTSSSSYHVM